MPTQNGEASGIELGMQITVSSELFKLPDALRTRVADHLDTIESQYFEHATDRLVAGVTLDAVGQPLKAQVTFSRARSFFTCDIAVEVGRGLRLRGEGEAADADTAFNAAVEHIAKRLRRFRRRVNAHARDSVDSSGGLQSEDAGQRDSGLVSEGSRYTGEIPSPEAAATAQLRMKETINEFAARKGMTVAQVEEAADNWKAVHGEVAERETTDRATAEPRAKKSASPELTAIRLAAAFEALKRSSDLENPKLSATERRRRARHLVRTYERLREHNPALEDDSGVVGRARSIVNDANYQRRKKAKEAAKVATMG